jgi:hypothetical protein
MTRPGRRSRTASLNARRGAAFFAAATATVAAAIISVFAADGLFFAAVTVATVAAAIISVFAVAADAISGVLAAARKTLSFLLRSRVRLREFSASGLTDLAGLLAGRGRPALRAEWRTHLAGESGDDPVTWRKVRQALGFVAAAIQLRLADAADLTWKPIDAVLGSRTLSNLFVGGAVIVVLFAIVHHDGRFGLVADDQDPVALGAFLYGVIRTGRWWRCIKPPPPKARRARE